MSFLASRRAARWQVIGLAAAGLSTLSYLLYARREAPHGGSGPGIAFGAAGLALVFVLLLFGVRKRAYKSRLGTLEGWLQAHMVLGVLSALVLLFHAGFRFHDRVAVAAYVVLLLVVLSGLAGAILYAALPRMLTEVESDLTATETSDRLNQLAQSMARLAAGKSPTFQRVCRGLLAEVRPPGLAGWRLLFGGAAGREARRPAGELATALALVEAGEREELRQMLVLSRQHKELHLRLRFQQRYRNLLDVWLWTHVPLSIALLALIAAHLAAVAYFS